MTHIWQGASIRRVADRHAPRRGGYSLILLGICTVAAGRLGDAGRTASPTLTAKPIGTDFSSFLRGRGRWPLRGTRPMPTTWPRIMPRQAADLRRQHAILRGGSIRRFFSLSPPLFALLPYPAAPHDLAGRDIGILRLCYRRHPATDPPIATPISAISGVLLAAGLSGGFSSISGHGQNGLSDRGLCWAPPC